MNARANGTNSATWHTWIQILGRRQKQNAWPLAARLLLGGLEVGLELLLELRVGALEELNLLRMLLLLQRPPLALTLLDDI